MVGSIPARRRLLTGLLSAASLVSGPSSALAQPQQPPQGPPDPQMMTDEAAIDDQAAREFFSSGRNLYDLGRFAEAAEQFRQAYELSHRSPLLYNLYLAYRDAGDLRRSADALRQYLQEMEDVPDRVNLEARLVGLEQRLAQEEAGREQAVREADEARQREEDARAEEQRRREAEEAARGPGATPWIIAGAGGALLVGGAVMGILALSAKSELDSECIEMVCNDLADVQSQAQTFSIVADVLFIAGGLTAAVGLAWGIIGSLMAGGETESAPATVSASCGPTGCAAFVGGRF